MQNQNETMMNDQDVNEEDQDVMFESSASEEGYESVVLSSEEEAFEADKSQFYMFLKENDLREEALALMLGENAEEATSVAATTEENLKGLRQRLGLTQKEMAAKLDVSNAIISLVESGKAPLSAKLKAKMLAL